MLCFLTPPHPHPKTTEPPKVMISGQKLSTDGVIRLGGEWFMQSRSSTVNGISMPSHPYRASFSGLSDSEAKDVELVKNLLPRRYALFGYLELNSRFPLLVPHEIAVALQHTSVSSSEIETSPPLKSPSLWFIFVLLSLLQSSYQKNKDCNHLIILMAPIAPSAILKNPWHPLLSSKTQRFHPSTNKRFTNSPLPNSIRVQAFRRSDFDGFAKRMTSGEAWRDAWRSANNGFEQLLYETKKTAERIDRRYSVGHRFSSVAQSASDRARELDRDFLITQRWRTFTLDFSQNWPWYRKQFSDFLDTPLGRSSGTIFFLWFALSGWLFKVLIFAIWVLPFAGPLLIGAVANNLVIKGACPACKRQFVGYKNQMVRCGGCGNIVWQPKGDLFSKGGNRASPSSKSEPDIIDVEFEEK
ncbi:hypothetical protein L6452_15000 [Arctium lappa]|uniref:Uncharacterized protein n=1 Tax=Arctium lappa TaxID=4217 RepID=A0ACB9CMN7_ARCLA|nr:hypothetical protein L6452_15000 [Arctium lappa]